MGSTQTIEHAQKTLDAWIKKHPAHRGYTYEVEAYGRWFCQLETATSQARGSGRTEAEAIEAALQAVKS